MGSTGAHTHGAAYLAVLVFVAVITISGLAFLQLAELEDRILATEARYAQAYSAARSGIQRVGWALRQLAILQAVNPSSVLNPFHEDLYPGPERSRTVRGLLDVVNPRPGETFYPSVEAGAAGDVSRRAYYRVTDLRGSGTKVLVRVLGAVDVDGDGAEGLGDGDGDGYAGLADADPQDTNRFLEALIGLPGTLGRDVSVAAHGLVDAGGRTVSLAYRNVGFLTSKGHALAGFWYDTRDAAEGRYRAVFSKWVQRADGGAGDIRGDVAIPRGLFGSSGERGGAGPPQMAYFQAAGLPIARYGGSQLFDADHDPTAGTPGGTVIWVDGDAVLRDVDLESWNRSDVVLVATGDLLVEDLDCGWSGRITLIARNLYLRAHRGGRIQGIAVASGDIHLLSAEQPADQWVEIPTVPGQAARLASYFYGAMVCGGSMEIEGGGWAVIFDRHIINGIMGLYPRDLLLDGFEQGGGPGACWTSSGQRVEDPSGGGYLRDEIDYAAGDSADGGSDGRPEVMRISWNPAADDAGIGDDVRLHLDGSPPGCETMLRDWTPYRAIEAFLALDNFRREVELAGGLKLVTAREVSLELGIRDDGGRELTASLEPRYDAASWGMGPYVFSGGDVADPHETLDDYDGCRAGHYLPCWRKIRIRFSEMVGDAARFDFRRVALITIRQVGVSLAWHVEDENGVWISSQRVESRSGTLRYVAGSSASPVRSAPATGRLQYEDPPGSGNWVDILWDRDGEDQDGDGDFLEDTMVEADLRSTLRMDRIALPGVERQNYGLPPFSLEAAFWRELSESEAGVPLE